MTDLSKYLEQVDNQLIAVQPCKITLDTANYELNENLQINDDNIWVSSLISKIEFEDLIFSLVLDYAVELQTQKEIDIDEGVELEFEKDSIVLVISMNSEGIKKQAQFIERLLGGREIYKDVNHLLKKIYTLYNKSGMDLVHMEVLASQCLRDRKNLSLPARLGKPWDPVMVNIKDIVFNSGFLQGLAFENINKSIEVGLTSGEDLEPSILERVLTGELVEERK